MLVSAVFNEVLPTEEHATQSIVTIDGPGMDAGVITRSTPDASDCYYLEISSDPTTAELDEYSIYRRAGDTFNLLHNDALTVILPTSSGIPVAIPSGTPVRVRLEAENLDSGAVSLSAWRGTTDNNFSRLTIISDTNPVGVHGNLSDNLMAGLLGRNVSGNLVSWDNFLSFVPLDFAYHDYLAGKTHGIGTLTDPNSSLSNLVNSVATSRVYNGPTTIRIRNDFNQSKILINHNRHKGVSWDSPGLRLSGYKNRPILTATNSRLVQLDGDANYIWFKGLELRTDIYATPGEMIHYGNKRCRITGTRAFLGSETDIQDYNNFTVGGGVSGDPSELWMEYCFIDIHPSGRAFAIVDVAPHPSGLGATLKLDHVLMRGRADHCVLMHGSGTVTVDIDHPTFVDVGDNVDRLNIIVSASGSVNLGEDPFVKNGIFANINNTDNPEHGIVIDSNEHKFITNKNLYYGLDTNETGVTDSISPVTTENPLFASETATFHWISSEISENNVSGIVLPKDWRPTNPVARRSATDGSDLGALAVVTVSPVITSTISTSALVVQLLENLRPLHTENRNYRMRYPISSEQWETAFSQIYKELVNLLGVKFIDSVFESKGFIGSTELFLDEAMEKQFRTNEPDTTNRYPIVGITTNQFSSGNFVNFLGDMNNDLALGDALFREWR